VNPTIPFEFKKSTQALNYLAHLNGGSISKLRAMKLIYFADRFHLRKYGRFITNANYVAMKLGPVPSEVLNIADSNFETAADREYANTFISTSNTKIKTVKAIQMEVFSETDRESLLHVWKKFGHFPRLPDLTHRFPEWRKHESDFKAGVKRKHIKIEDFLENAPDDLEYCPKLSDDDKSLLIEQIRDASSIHASFRR
jgi:uncharacterized phage-associated protein